MELNFLGRGAGFNPAEGSTSAYFIDNDALFLIDCGESVFKTVLEQKILDGVSRLNVFITHTHSDHTGSLGSLVLYASIEKRMTVTLITGETMGYLAGIRALLGIFGITEGMFCFADVSVFDNTSSVFRTVRYVKTSHCDELESCGLLFETEAGLVFFSGDMRTMDPLIEIIKSGRPIDKLYVDSNNNRNPSPHHISIHHLNEIVPPELKPKIHCMHINNSRCAEEARAYGFNVAALHGSKTSL